MYFSELIQETTTTEESSSTTVQPKVQSEAEQSDEIPEKEIDEIDQNDSELPEISDIPAESELKPEINNAENNFDEKPETYEEEISETESETDSQNNRNELENLVFEQDAQSDPINFGHSDSNPSNIEPHNDDNEPVKTETDETDEVISDQETSIENLPEKIASAENVDQTLEESDTADVQASENVMYHENIKIPVKSDIADASDQVGADNDPEVNQTGKQNYEKISNEADNDEIKNRNLTESAEKSEILTDSLASSDSFQSENDENNLGNNEIKEVVSKQEEGWTKFKK